MWALVILAQDAWMVTERRSRKESRFVFTVPKALLVMEIIAQVSQNYMKHLEKWTKGHWQQKISTFYNKVFDLNVSLAL